ncbi:MAG: bifunctional adenosylcobinamide kinase/adenosylcobinamide-phosphate guanylyltransferase [Eubacteriales bacterium]|nr:bifunctional adenosylcobinamide kinase/adenosylcobinamide-phosphate guanylyltransferase [Eubacteriales bacterium]
MRLMLGGYAQGKLRCLFRREKAEHCMVFEGRLPSPEELQKALLQDKTVVINRLHRWIRERLTDGGDPEEELFAFLERCPDCVLIGDEIGNGIVPVDAFEREYRERTGRLLEELAYRAKEVELILCGISRRIK